MPGFPKSSGRPLGIASQSGHEAHFREVALSLQVYEHLLLHRRLEIERLGLA